MHRGTHARFHRWYGIRLYRFGGGARLAHRSRRSQRQQAISERGSRVVHQDGGRRRRRRAVPGPPQPDSLSCVLSHKDTGSTNCVDSVLAGSDKGARCYCGSEDS